MEEVGKILAQEMAERRAEQLRIPDKVLDDFEEIEARDRRRWAKHDLRIDHYTDECPRCNRGGEQVPLEADFLSDTQPRTLRMAMRCPLLNCDTVYFAVYHATNPLYDDVFFYTRSEPITPEPYEVSEAIKNLSGDFGAIASEAKAAEESGLMQICGPGYRKALEFLVKDYAISRVGSDDEKASIKKKLLGACIADHVDDPRIKAMAKRTAALGNDETHYERRWEDHDINDLKALLRLTVRFIESELEAAQYVEDMPL